MIQRLFKEGKSFSNFPLRVIYMPAKGQDSNLRAGFTVNAKYFKKAVDRNRVKRVLRESYRLQKNKLEDELIKNDHQLALFFIYTSAELPNYNDIFEKLGNILERIEGTLSAK